MEKSVFDNFESNVIDSSKINSYQGGDTGDTEGVKTVKVWRKALGVYKGGFYESIKVAYGDWDDRDLCCE